MRDGTGGEEEGRTRGGGEGTKIDATEYHATNNLIFCGHQSVYFFYRKYNLLNKTTGKPTEVLYLELRFFNINPATR